MSKLPCWAPVYGWAPSPSDARQCASQSASAVASVRMLLQVPLICSSDWASSRTRVACCSSEGKCRYCIYMRRMRCGVWRGVFVPNINLRPDSFHVWDHKKNQDVLVLVYTVYSTYYCSAAVLWSVKRDFLGSWPILTVPTDRLTGRSR